MMNQTVDEQIAALDALIGTVRVTGMCSRCKRSVRYNCECDVEPGEPTGVADPDLMAGYHYPNM